MILLPFETKSNKKNIPIKYIYEEIQKIDSLSSIIISAVDNDFNLPENFDVLNTIIILNNKIKSLKNIISPHIDKLDD